MRSTHHITANFDLSLHLLLFSTYLTHSLISPPQFTPVPTPYAPSASPSFFLYSFLPPPIAVSFLSPTFPCFLPSTFPSLPFGLPLPTGAPLPLAVHPGFLRESIRFMVHPHRCVRGASKGPSRLFPLPRFLCRSDGHGQSESPSKGLVDIEVYEVHRGCIQGSIRQSIRQ